MNWRAWFALRGPRYAAQRAGILLGRYGIAPDHAMTRAQSIVAALSERGCSLTYPTPGRVVEQHPAFFRRLQAAGAEIAVHSYDHLDLATYPPAQASEQLMRAAAAFARHGIEAHGFRCPYLRYTEDLFRALPRGAFGYSSNRAIWWDVIPPNQAGHATSIMEVLRGFYKPESALDTVCIPRMRDAAGTGPGIVEIPVCVPDDLQLHDGLHMDADGIARVWHVMLGHIHQRGEIFDLVFHPELAQLCQAPLLAAVEEARRLQPGVWIALLRDVADWWREKAGFGVTATEWECSPAVQQTRNAARRLRVTFTCSPRATVLVKGLEVGDLARPWDGTYKELKVREVDLPADPRPFVGLPAEAPAGIASCLRELGYLLDTSRTATYCGIYLDAATLACFTRPETGQVDEVRLVEAIESSPGPLVRYGRWPEGAKSALAISGDLDALTLFDYASRLVVR
jgi:peptidoglycan/xylan/chitin deacetylase (PgdA/CDA1 family)